MSNIILMPPVLLTTQPTPEEIKIFNDYIDLLHSKIDELDKRITALGG